MRILSKPASGDWWAVFLGTRPYQPYEEYYHNTGRETFLAPVKWENGWPVILKGDEEVQYYYPCPIQPAKDFAERSYSGNFTWRDEFDKESINRDWMFLRTPHEKWFNLEKRKGSIALQLRSETCSGDMNPSFLGHRQQHLKGSASIKIDFNPKTENEKAGLLLFHNENHYYLICKSLEGNQPVVQLYKANAATDSKSEMELITYQKLKKNLANKELYLKIQANGTTYSFFYAIKPDKWNLLKDSVDAKFVSTRAAGGFIGSVYALYATSSGKPSKNVSYFDWFEYCGDDEVYKR